MHRIEREYLVKKLIYENYKEIQKVSETLLEKIEKTKKYEHECLLCLEKYLIQASQSFDGYLSSIVFILGLFMKIIKENEEYGGYGEINENKDILDWFLFLKSLKEDEYYKNKDKFLNQIKSIFLKLRNSLNKFYDEKILLLNKYYKDLKVNNILNCERKLIKKEDYKTLKFKNTVICDALEEYIMISIEYLYSGNKFIESANKFLNSKKKSGKDDDVDFKAAVKLVSIYYFKKIIVPFLISIPENSDIDFRFTKGVKFERFLNNSSIRTLIDFAVCPTYNIVDPLYASACQLKMMSDLGVKSMIITNEREAFKKNAFEKDLDFDDFTILDYTKLARETLEKSSPYNAVAKNKI